MSSADSQTSGSECSDSEEEQLVAVTVLHCGVCGLPAEYCEYSSTFSKCKPWLKEHCPDLYPQLLTEDISEGVSKIEVSAEEDAPETKEETPKKKRAKSGPQVTIKMSTRNKRKFVTSVAGLEDFDVKLKDAAKKFAGKFACGASVVANASGGKEIDIQGDFRYELEELLPDMFPSIPQDKIKVLEEKKKKKDK